MDYKPNKVMAVAQLLPNGGWSMVEDTVIFDDPTDPTNPTEGDIQYTLDVLNEKYVRDEYIRLRVVAYAKLNQDELRFDDIINGTNTWVEAIQAIKAEFPKGE